MKKRILFILLMFVVGSAWAARIDHATAQKAITNWIQRNGIAKSLFSNAEIVDISPYDADANLWIAQLAPHGYIILSGTDLRKPVIAFSQNDFEWPEEGSPFLARLNMSAEATVAVEAEGGVVHEGWAALLHEPSLKLRATAVDSSKIIVQPFMTETHWDQCQPYNDFSPIYNPSSSSTYYRGRTPCGCVATAMAQILAYWKWPVRTDETHTWNHGFYPNGDSQPGISFPIRFDGHTPFDWGTLADTYPCYFGYNRYDMRGRVAENERFPVARLILFADHLAQMEFASNGSGAYLEQAVFSATPWYEPAWVVGIAGNDYQAVSDLLKEELVAHRPVLVGIPGHAIVAHGWAEDGENSDYVYHNYGWGGSNDGWYLVTGGDQAENMNVFCAKFVPKKTVQIDPLPKVVGTSATLDWHLPECYTNDVYGFYITETVVLDESATFNDDFSQTKGSFTDSDPLICGVVTKSGVGNTSQLLYMDPLYENSYTYTEPFFLTSRSELSFRYMSSLALGSEFEVQVRFDDGEWMTATTCSLNLTSGYDSWKTKTLFLGNHGGSVMQLRFAVARTGNSYYQGSRAICIDDVMVSDVQSTEKTTRVVSGSLRSYNIASSNPGRIHSYIIKPISVLGGGISSAAVQTRMAGQGKTALPAPKTATSRASVGAIAWETRDFVQMEHPQIVTVTGSEGYPQVTEGFYRENALGENVLRVRCSQSVTELKAHPSHLALVADEDIEVHSCGGGEFAVVIHADAQKIPNRSRMILTLEAQNANGTAVYKDLSLRFDETVSPESYVPRLVAIDVAMSTLSGETTVVSIPCFWFVESGLLEEATSGVDYEGLALEDSDGDGFTNVTEYICGTNPTDAVDRLVCYIQMVNGEPIVTHSLLNVAPGFRVVVKGSATLKNPNWQAKTNEHRFFKVVVENVEEGQ